MEEQTTYQEPFKEEYWAAALDTLKKEERKAMYKKWTPAALALLLLAALVLGFQLNKDAAGLPIKETNQYSSLESRFASIASSQKEQVPIKATSTNSKEDQEVPQQSIAKVRGVEKEEGTQTNFGNEGKSQAKATTVGANLKSDLQAEDSSKPDENQAPEPFKMQGTTSEAEGLAGQVNEEKQAQAGDKITAGQLVIDQKTTTESNSNDDKSKGSFGEEMSGQGADADASMLAQEKGTDDEAITAIENQRMNLLSGNINNAVPSLFTPRVYSKKQLRDSERQARFRRQCYPGSSLKGYIGSAVLTGYGSEKGLIDWNPTIGLTYEKKVHGPWWASVGLGFQQINGVRYQADFFADELSFGYNTVRTRVATNTLYILEVPVQVWRDFSLRSALMLGGNAEVIINSKSGLSETKLGGNESQELSNSNSFGYVQGLNQMLFGARAGYRYRLNKNTEISLIKQFGLSEVNNGKFYLNNGNDLNNRWMLQLNFTLK